MENIISIKNNKIEVDYKKSTLIKTKKTNKPIAVLLVLRAVTKRKIHTGINVWNLYYLIPVLGSEKLPKYEIKETKEELSSLKLGKYDGINKYLVINNYKIETVSLENALNLIDGNKFKNVISEDNKNWKISRGYIDIDF